MIVCFLRQKNTRDVEICRKGASVGRLRRIMKSKLNIFKVVFVKMHRKLAPFFPFFLSLVVWIFKKPKKFRAFSSKDFTYTKFQNYTLSRSSLPEFAFGNPLNVDTLFFSFSFVSVPKRWKSTSYRKPLFLCVW